ncbi:MAG: hypothetical protein ABI778_03875 [Ignavibacteriota bacterium]
MSESNPKFHIILRTCDVVHSLHNAPRPFDLDKRSLIKICFKSLYNSVKDYPHRITVLGDRLSDEMKDFFRGYPVTLLNEELGNDKSIRRQIELALESPEEEWIYFVEDDYLHTPNAFKWINDFIINRSVYMSTKLITRQLRSFRWRIDNKPLIIHTPDYPDRYLPRYLRFSMIFISKYCHWRQITNTTFTYLMQGKTVHKYKQTLLRSSIGADDGFLSRKLFGGFRFGSKALCVSPIPGVSTHMHEEVMTPLVDWEKVKKENS